MMRESSVHTISGFIVCVTGIDAEPVLTNQLLEARLAEVTTFPLPLHLC